MMELRSWDEVGSLWMFCIHGSMVGWIYSTIYLDLFLDILSLCSTRSPAFGQRIYQLSPTYIHIHICRQDAIAVVFYSYTIQTVM